MLFNSMQFLAFFVVVYILYLGLGTRGQNRLLLVASYVFYGAWDIRFLGLLFASTVVDYLVGLGLGRSSDPRVRRRLIATSVTFQLSVLGFFKYFNFFAESLTDLLGHVGLAVSPPILDVVLPIGVSFYTFASMSYTIDVYRGRLMPCRSFLDFALFVAFFPQLVAGPIERGSALIPQIQGTRVITPDHLSEGLFLILWGLFKKDVVADNLGSTVDAIFQKTHSFQSGEVLVGAMFFAFQIYGDFSGYTDMARGIAKLMGFELLLNFNLPYFARNPSDFWRRWHISLSSWLRDYLYVSLGGNRGGTLRTYRNLMLTMVLGGLWHGAAWNYVCWGIYHGGLLAAHRYLHDIGLLGRTHRRRPALEFVAQASAVLVMFVFTLYGWMLFRSRSLDQIVGMTRSFFDIALNPFLLHSLGKLAFYCWPIFVLELYQYLSGDIRILMRSPVSLQTASFAAILFFVVVFGNYGGASFIYFQF